MWCKRRRKKFLEKKRKKSSENIKALDFQLKFTVEEGFVNEFSFLFNLWPSLFVAYKDELDLTAESAFTYHSLNAKEEEKKGKKKISPNWIWFH